MFDGKCVQQLYSVQPLPSYAIVLIKAFFNKILYHNQI